MQHEELVSKLSGSGLGGRFLAALEATQVFWNDVKGRRNLHVHADVNGSDHLHGDLPACAGLLMACWIYGGSGQCSSGTVMGHHSVFKRYGRWEPQLDSCWGLGCPRLTSAGHGPWYFSVELPAAAGTRRAGEKYVDGRPEYKELPQVMDLSPLGKATGRPAQARWHQRGRAAGSQQ